MPYAFHLRLGGVQWPIFIYYDTEVILVYDTEAVLLYFFFYYWILWYVTYTLIVTSYYAYL